MGRAASKKEINVFQSKTWHKRPLARPRNGWEHNIDRGQEIKDRYCGLD
jgi:hypothetical protein